MGEYFKSPYEFIDILHRVRIYRKDPNVIKVILGGSTVGGRGPAHNDLDLLVIRSGNKPFAQSWVRGTFSRTEIHALVINETAFSEVKADGEKGEPFRSLLENGRVLYERQ